MCLCRSVCTPCNVIVYVHVYIIVNCYVHVHVYAIVYDMVYATDNVCVVLVVYNIEY